MILGGLKDANDAMDGLPGGGDNPKPGAPQPPAPPRMPKPKKAVGLGKQTSSKIQFCSGKLTEVKVFVNKVENAPL